MFVWSFTYVSHLTVLHKYYNAISASHNKSLKRIFDSPLSILCIGVLAINHDWFFSFLWFFHNSREILVRKINVMVTSITTTSSVCAPSCLRGQIGLTMDEWIAVEQQRLPFFTARGGHTHGQDAIEELQHHSLILLEQFVGEFSHYFQEGQIGRRSCRIVRILQWIGGEQDSVPMQGSDGLAVFQRVQAER